MLKHVAFAALFPFSSLLSAAGVTIDVDLEMTIDQIKYVDLDDSLNADLTHSKLSTFSSFAKEFPTDYLPLVVENDDLSLTFLYRDGNLLKRVTHTQEGTQTSRTYPEISYDFDRAYLIDDRPLVIDLDQDTLLRWDDVQDSWLDLSTALTLPTGEYDQEAFVFDNQLYFSAKDSGTWKLGLSPENVSLTRIQNARLAVTAYGLAELNIDGERVYINWLSKDYPDLDLSFISDYGPVSAFAVSSAQTGTLYQFIVNGSLMLLWDDMDNSKDRYVNLPIGSNLFKGCHWTSKNLLCAFVSDNNWLSFYEMKDGKLSLESEFQISDINLAQLQVKTVFASGQSRFVAVAVATETINVNRLYELQEGHQILLEEYVVEDGQGYANLRMSRDASQFYWIEAGHHKVQVYRGGLSGNLDFERIVPLSEGVANPIPDEPVENVNNEASDANDGSGSDEGIGSLGSSLFLAWLLVLTARRRTLNI